jgi:thiol-disulfide isomerase/thioredoxin
MKRSILIALLTGFIAVGASAQQRKVLVEEFTSSTCPPCAATDPIMEQFESEYADRIVVLKYHQNYPAAGDIMYKAYPKGYDRGNLYSVHQTGIPWVEFNGISNVFPNSVDVLKTNTDDALAASQIYYGLGINQSITKDSIIALVTVKAGAAIDPLATLTIVVSEANIMYQGSNGRPYHRDAARIAVPGFTTEGAPSGPALDVAANGEKVYRFAAPLKADWNKALLRVVAIVQNPDTKEVLGVETSAPQISLERKGGAAGIPGSTTVQPHWVAKNNGTTPQTVVFTAFLSKATPYSGTVKMVDGTPVGANGITLAPGEEKEIVIAFTTSAGFSLQQRPTLSSILTRHCRSRRITPAEPYGTVVLIR